VKIGALNLGEDAMNSMATSEDGAGGLGGGESGAAIGGAGGSGGGGGSGSGEGQDEGGSRNPFRFQKGHKLATSDMQVRSLVFQKSIAETNAEIDRIVRITRWGRNGGNPSQSLINAAHGWGMLSFAQAEYYFDGTGVGRDDAFCNPKNPRDWLWYIGWTARLRRFRLNWTGHDENGNEVDADGDSESKGDDVQGTFDFAKSDLINQLMPGGQSADGTNPACVGADCNKAKENMNLFQNLFLH
jgi:hypothetical protein